MCFMYLGWKVLEYSFIPLMQHMVVVATCIGRRHHSLKDEPDQT